MVWVIQVWICGFYATEPAKMCYVNIWIKEERPGLEVSTESSDYGTDTVMRWAVTVLYGSVFGTKTTSHCFQKVIFMAVKRQSSVQEDNLRHWKKIKGV